MFLEHVTAFFFGLLFYDFVKHVFILLWEKWEDETDEEES